MNYVLPSIKVKHVATNYAAYLGHGMEHPVKSVGMWVKVKPVAKLLKRIG